MRQDVRVRRHDVLVLMPLGRRKYLRERPPSSQQLHCGVVPKRVSVSREGPDRFSEDGPGLPLTRSIHGVLAASSALAHGSSAGTRVGNWLRHRPTDQSIKGGRRPEYPRGRSDSVPTVKAAKVFEAFRCKCGKPARVRCFNGIGTHWVEREDGYGMGRSGVDESSPLRDLLAATPKRIEL
jgi:hypothetical protein